MYCIIFKYIFLLNLIYIGNIKTSQIAENVDIGPLVSWSWQSNCQIGHSEDKKVRRQVFQETSKAQDI